MIRVPFPAARFALLASVLLLEACGAGTQAPVQRPAPLAERAIRAPRRQAEPPPLIAPPPAYGNKIVMARGEDPITTN